MGATLRELDQVAVEFIRTKYGRRPFSAAGAAGRVPAIPGVGPFAARSIVPGLPCSVSGWQSRLRSLEGRGLVERAEGEGWRLTPLALEAVGADAEPPPPAEEPEPCEIVFAAIRRRIEAAGGRPTLISQRRVADEVGLSGSAVVSRFVDRLVHEGRLVRLATDRHGTTLALAAAPEADREAGPLAP